MNTVSNIGQKPHLRPQRNQRRYVRCHFNVFLSCCSPQTLWGSERRGVRLVAASRPGDTTLKYQDNTQVNHTEDETPYEKTQVLYLPHASRSVRFQNISNIKHYQWNRLQLLEWYLSLHITCTFSVLHFSSIQSVLSLLVFKVFWDLWKYFGCCCRPMPWKACSFKMPNPSRWKFESVLWLSGDSLGIIGLINHERTI